MKLTPLDMEDSNSRWNNRPIKTEAELTAILADSHEKRPFLLQLEGDNGFKLIIGVGGPVGCAQFSSVDGNTPYQMAVSKGGQTADSSEAVEFLAGGTPTPIPIRRCVPFEALKRIVIQFFEKGDRSREVEWEEV